MASTYEPIASTTLGSSASSVTFSGIAADWTDLVVVSAATTNQSGYGHVIQVNSDTNQNYSTTILYGTGSTATSVRGTNYSFFYGAYQGAAGSVNPNVSIMHFMSYANTSVYKTMLVESAGPDWGVDRMVALWRSTAAITSISITAAPSKTYNAGSTFSIYGIKAA